MRSLVARLERLEQREAQAQACKNVRLLVGHLKQLPADYTGERHVAIVGKLPESPPNADWYEFEERPGPEPAGSETAEDGTRTIYILGVESRWSKPEASL